MRKVYLDTNVFIYAFEGNPEEWGHLQSFFEFAGGQGAFVTSELTLAEILAPNLSGGLDQQAFYQNLLIWSGIIALYPVTRDILIETVDVRKRCRLKLPDAIHVATGLIAGCEFFVSHDKQANRTPPEMTHIDPTIAGIRDLVERLSV